MGVEVSREMGEREGRANEDLQGGGGGGAGAV